MLSIEKDSKTSFFPDHGIREKIRLSSLDSYGVLDTAPEPEFDDFVRRASLHFRTPISSIALIDGRRQWFKAKVGLTISQTDRSVAFCNYVVDSGALLVVPDAKADSRFAENPMVTGGPRVRFYAGAPLITPLSRVLGTINVIDTIPRHGWSDADTAALEAMAAEVMLILERRRSDFVRQRALATHQ